MAGEIPVYGPGISNKLIPWFNVTKAPFNYALTPYMGNRLTWYTFGEENQPVAFPLGKTPLEYTLAQDTNNPNHISQWNPLLVGYDLGNFNMTNPIATAQGNANAYQYGYQMAQNQIINEKVSTIARALGSLEGQLTSTLKSDKLTDAQRTKLEALLEEVKAKKAEIESKLQEKPTVEELEAIQGEIIAIQEKVSKTVDEIISEIEGKPSASASNSDGNTSISSDAAKKAEEQNKKDLTAALDICKDIYNGSLGRSWYQGTDYDIIKKGSNKINKNNAATVILAWDQQFKSTKGKSLVKALFDEEHFWNPKLQDRGTDGKIANPKVNVDIIWNIVVSLEEAAKETGVYNELMGDFTVAYDELDDTCVDQEAIENAVDKIAKRVYEAQIEKSGKDAQTAIDNKTKNDEAKEKTDAKKEAWKLFTVDMKEIFEDDELKVSNKVEYKDGKFQIRILGDVFEGKTFKELAKAIKDAGLDPKEYLAEKHINTAA